MARKHMNMSKIFFFSWWEENVLIKYCGGLWADFNPMTTCVGIYKTCCLSSGLMSILKIWNRGYMVWIGIQDLNSQLVIFWWEENVFIKSWEVCGEVQIRPRTPSIEIYETWYLSNDLRVPESYWIKKIWFRSRWIFEQLFFVFFFSEKRMYSSIIATFVGCQTQDIIFWNIGGLLFSGCFDGWPADIESRICGTEVHENVNSPHQSKKATICLNKSCEVRWDL